jgi:spermidine/putrescine-binding protein
MDRRRFLTGGAAGLAGALAGCMGGRLNFSAKPKVRWDYNWEGFVGQGFQPAIIVTGSVENYSDAFAQEVRIICELTSGDGRTIANGERTLEQLAAGETQHFYFKFNVSGSDVQNFDSVQMEVYVDGEKM